MRKLHVALLQRRTVLLSALLLGLAGCGGGGGDPAPLLEAGAVSSPDQFGAQAAKDILAKGGNAVDAGVAVAFALAVTMPSAGNIGGGGFMTIYMDGKPYFVDYREMAP
ncbi:MAG TPA: gamma-glutamyltransferase, partial [Pseudorhodoferax sp.]|nr:gamma-glutamyltransferase [Pseudorhodoferax sp.]